MTETIWSPAPSRIEQSAEAGFADAVVLIEPGGPTPEQVRSLLL